MSDYVRRLIMRTRAAGAGQFMRPFVRSTSPIAERDQRIGMRGMEGMATASEAGLEQDDGLQAPSLSSLTAAGTPEGVTVQRKMTSPAASPSARVSSLAPGLTPGSAHMEADMPLSGQEAGHYDVRLPSIARQQVINQVTPSAPPSSISEQAGAPQDVVPLSQPPRPDAPPGALGTPSFSPERDSVAESHDLRASVLRHGSAQTPETLRFSAAADMPGRATRRVHQVETRLLEPAARTFAEALEARPLDASTPPTDADESPRIVIGRINVEVVPPPATPQGTTTPRPLTAASVSVIEPLSGGVRPNLHLSLRHR